MSDINETENLQERDLPGMEFATFLNFIGWSLLTVAAILVMIVFVSEGRNLLLLLPAGKLVLCSLGAFSVVVIIRAVNANTLEIRKLSKQ